MALYRDIKFNTGTLQDRMGAVVSGNTGTFAQHSKGQALDTNSSKYTTYGSSLLPSGAFTVVVWARLRDSHLTTDKAQVISTNNVVGAGSIALQYGSNPLLYLGGSNYTYFTYPIPGDKNWHCWVFTIPGSAQSDINSAQCFVDNVSYARTGTISAGAQYARTGYVYAGGSATQTGGCMISRIKVYDTVLSQTEITNEYAEFLNAQPINKPKRGFILNKPNDLSHLKGSGAGQGLIAAYNMKKVGNTLVDISGNGNNLTLAAGNAYSTKNGLGFPNSGYYTKAGFVGLSTGLNTNAYTISMRVKFNEFSREQHLVEFTSTNRFINGSNQIVLAGISGILISSALVTKDWYTITFLIKNIGAEIYINGVSNVSNSNYTENISTLNLFIANYYGGGAYILNGEIADVRIHNRVLTPQECRDYHNQFIQHTLVEDFSDMGADGIATTDVPREWERVSGTWKKGEINLVSGFLYQSNFTTTDSWFAALGASVASGVTIGGLTNCLEVTISSGNSYHVAQRTTVDQSVGKKYSLKGKIYFPSSGLANGLEIASIDGLTVYKRISLVEQNTWVNFEATFVARGGNPDTIRIIPLASNVTPYSNDGQKYYLRDITLEELPPLPTLPKGAKYLECVTAGKVIIPIQNVGYGSWEIDYYKGNVSNQITFGLNDLNAQTSQYAFIEFADERLTLYKLSSLLSTAVSYVQNFTWYRIRITRTAAGTFTLLIKGGAFVPTAGYDGWTLVSVTSGTNPITDTTYTVGNYFSISSNGSGDRFANLDIEDEIKQ